jgi:glycerol-3-phosphate dehydrogenase (NAD(P)+)
MQNTKVTIIGAGKYGSAIAYTVQEDPARQVTFVARNPDVVAEINNERRSSRIGDDSLRWNSNVRATTSVEEGLKDCDIIFLSIPAQSIPAKLTEMQPFLEKKTLIVNCSKGMILAKEKFLCEIIAEEYPDLLDNYMTLSGPSFASEVFKKFPTQVVVAGKNQKHAIRVIDSVASSFFKSYWQDDVIGCELAGALKNVLALGAGYIEGMGFGFNTMACWVTRGVKEVQICSGSFGANPLTLIGLSGAGDIMLSCFGGLSRNRQCGSRLARGEK